MIYGVERRQREVGARYMLWVPTTLSHVDLVRLQVLPTGAQPSTRSSQPAH